MPEYMNQKQAAAYIGVCLNTFKKHIRPYIKQKSAGSKLLFPKKDIDSYMNSDTTILHNKLQRARR